MKTYSDDSQKSVPLITEADLEAFSMKRFRFAQASDNQDVAATLRLLEQAMGPRRIELAAIYGPALQQAIHQQRAVMSESPARANDDTLW